MTPAAAETSPDAQNDAVLGRAPAADRRVDRCASTPTVAGSAALALAAAPLGVALAAAVAAGQRDSLQLTALGLSALLAACGASALRRRHADVSGVALVALALACSSLLGLGASLYVLAGVTAFALSAVWLEPRTPFAVVLTGAALSCAALAGWETEATTMHPTPLLVAAVVFLWTPSHVWSRSLAPGLDSRAPGLATLVAIAGRERTASAVLATTLGLVVATLVVAPQLGWPYTAVAVPAGALLLARASTLRRPSETSAAAYAHRLSGAYLLTGLVVSTL